MNSIFVLHALAARLMLQVRLFSYCNAAYRSAIHANRSDDKTAKDQVADIVADPFSRP